MPAGDVRLHLQCIHKDVDVVIPTEDVLVGADKLCGEAFAEDVHAVSTEQLTAEDIVEAVSTAL